MDWLAKLADELADELADIRARRLPFRLWKPKWAFGRSRGQDSGPRAVKDSIAGNEITKATTVPYTSPSANSSSCSMPTLLTTSTQSGISLPSFPPNSLDSSSLSIPTLSTDSFTTSSSSSVSTPNCSTPTANILKGSNANDGSPPRRHYDTFIGKPATYHDLPIELRIEIWSWLLVDYKHPARLWKIGWASKDDSMYVIPIGRCQMDHAIYTERRRDPINKMLHMDAAAHYAVYSRFKPVPLGGFLWDRECRKHLGRCAERGCPLERAMGCQCKIMWVDPANDVFIISEDTFLRSHSLRIRRVMFAKWRMTSRQDSCRLHKGTRLGGIDVVQNVLITYEAFVRRKAWEEAYILNWERFRRHLPAELKHQDESWARDRAELLRLPSLRRAFLLVNGESCPYREEVSWAKFRPPFLHLFDTDDDGPRDWLDGMAFTDVAMNGWPNPDRGGQGRAIEWRLGFRRAKRVQQLEKSFTAPFAAKGVAHQFLVWDKKIA